MGRGWLAEDVSPDHHMKFDETQLASLEVIGWSSGAGGSMKSKVRTTWISTGTQSAQVLMEHGGVANLESGSFGTWCGLMSSGVSYEWSIFPFLCGKGWGMSSIPCASQAWSFLRTLILMAEVTPVCLDRWWIPKNHSLESWTKWVKTQYRQSHRVWGPAPGDPTVLWETHSSSLVLACPWIHWYRFLKVLCLPTYADSMD